MSGETRLGPVRRRLDGLDRPAQRGHRALLNRRAQRVGHLGADRVASQNGRPVPTWTAVSYRVDGKNRLGGYGLLNLRAQWQVAPGWQVLGRVNNVAGKSTPRLMATTSLAASGCSACAGRPSCEAMSLGGGRPSPASPGPGTRMGACPLCLTKGP